MVIAKGASSPELTCNSQVFRMAHCPLRRKQEERPPQTQHLEMHFGRGSQWLSYALLHRIVSFMLVYFVWAGLEFTV